MGRERPPRGYEMQDYPLPHSCFQQFELGGESATLNSTIIPLFRSSLAATGEEAVEVNPKNALFAKEGGHTCFQGSIIPPIKSIINC